MLILVDQKDVFSALPTLLPCTQDGAEDILRTIAEQCSAKEVVIALQESAEKLMIELTDAETFEEEEQEDPEETETVPPARQAICILKMYVKGAAMRVLPQA